MKKNTIIAHDEIEDCFKQSIVPPISQSSIFTFKTYEELENYVYNDGTKKIYGYTRGDNPTVNLLEEKLASLSHGEECVCVSSGEAAIVLTLLSCLNRGDHLICVSTIYSSAKKFINEYLVKNMNVQVSFVDGKDVEEFANSIQENTKLVYLESPSSAVFQLQDIEAICNLVKPKGIKVAIDNTCATAFYQKPLLLGVDYEIHSISKYISGHSDVVAGAIIGNRENISKIRNKESILIGSTLSPFDAWLALRGLRTLPLRLKEQERKANYLASSLEKNNKISKVHHVSLDSFEQKELFKKQMTGSSGIFSFEVNTTKKKTILFVNHLNLFKLGISWGGYESMLYISSLSKPYYKEADENVEIPVIFRINVGLEDENDLLNDLEQAIKYL